MSLKVVPCHMLALTLLGSYSTLGLVRGNCFAFAGFERNPFSYEVIAILLLSCWYSVPLTLVYIRTAPRELYDLSILNCQSALARGRRLPPLNALEPLRCIGILPSIIRANVSLGTSLRHCELISIAAFEAMHADFRIGLGSLLAIACAISSVQAFYIPGETLTFCKLYQKPGKECPPGSKP